MKKRLYSFISIITLAALLLTQAGCGSSAASSSPSGTASSSEGSAGSEYYSEDSLGNQYITIPEDTVLLVYEGDPSRLRTEMAEAMAGRPADVCIKNQALWFDSPDFYAMPYSTFWLKDYSGEGLYGQMKGDEKKTFFHFYHFTYYDLTEDELEEMKTQIDDAASAVISLIPEDADDWTKARIVHDELCRLITYDQSLESPHCHDTYGALALHSAVCSGYACAFSHIMTQLGFYCPLSYSDDHAWNHMGVSSDQQYIDTTWDDMDLYDAYGDPYISYNYFFLTREEVESIDSHSIESMDPYTTSYYPESYNYYAHEGYLVSSYDWDTILDMYYRQYITGANLISVRFENEEDYQLARAWPENDAETLNELFTALDYYGSYYYWYNDNLQTVSFGLYPPEEAPAS